MMMMMMSHFAAAAAGITTQLTVSSNTSVMLQHFCFTSLHFTQSSLVKTFQMLSKPRPLVLIGLESKVRITILKKISK